MQTMQKKGSWWRRRRMLVIALIVIALGAWWVLGRSHGAKGPALDFVSATKGHIEENVTAQGKVTPKNYVDVGAQVSGQLMKLYVQPGSEVKKGQLIAEIDPRIVQAKLDADEASLRSLQAQLVEEKATTAYTKSVYDRNAKLMSADAVSKDAFNDSKRQYDASVARAKSIGAQIEQQSSTITADKTNLGYTKIYAPMTGTVTTQTAKEGQTLNANQTAPVIVQVANLDLMEISAQVAEADVSRLKAGMPVYFNTLGSDRKWESKVLQINPAPDATVTDVVLYNALVDVDNKDRQLMSGMSTQMFFVLGSADDALLIPARALGKKVSDAKDGKGEIYEVRVKTEKGMDKRQVEIGLLDRNQAQVISGISEGETVAVPAAPKTTTPGSSGSSSSGARRMAPRI